ncbi:MOSC N-terminal beta barrel domain-containing protein [Mycena floridula]|nr:MOSC N-terminal beta barrel domain-containing protein [Mycena floridula]
MFPVAVLAELGAIPTALLSWVTGFLLLLASVAAFHWLSKTAKPVKSRMNQPNFGFGDATRVSRLFIHPIKSCRGISVQKAAYTPSGLEHDRKWCIIDAETKTVITARDVSKMVLITPTVNLSNDTLDVAFPADSDCESFSVPLLPSPDWTLIDNITLWDDSLDGYICGGPSSRLLSAYFEKQVHLIFKGPRPRPCEPTSSYADLKAVTDFADGYPLLILSEESVQAVETELRAHVGKQGIEERWKTDALVMERFRANITLRGGKAFDEDLWEEIAIASDSDQLAAAPIISVVSKCPRCLLPNVAPDTGIRDAAVPFKVMMKMRIGIDPQNKWKAVLGVNAAPRGCGMIRVGDRVLVRKIEKAKE